MRLMQVAAEFVGGEKQLAVRLGIAPSLLCKLMAGLYHVPDPLVLRVVDIVLAHRQSLIPLVATGAADPGGEP